MARMTTATPIQTSGFNKRSAKPFYDELSSPTRYTKVDLQKGRRCTVRAYIQNERDPYATLGISPGSSKQEIKSAFRRLALQYHPDVCKDDGCANKFKQIKMAYEFAVDMAGMSQSGSCMDESMLDSSPLYSEGLMGVYDDSWEDWEEWMGWEGAGTRDYSTHINVHL